MSRLLFAVAATALLSINLSGQSATVVDTTRLGPQAGSPAPALPALTSSASPTR